MEKEKGCGFCESKKYETMIGTTFNFGILINNSNDLFVRYCNTKEIIDEVARIEIYYCPKCGKKL